MQREGNHILPITQSTWVIMTAGAYLLLKARINTGSMERAFGPIQRIGQIPVEAREECASPLLLMMSFLIYQNQMAYMII